MRSFLKSRVLWGLLAAVLLGLFLVPRTIYASLIVRLIEKNIRTSEIFISMLEPDLAFIGISFQEIVIRPRQSPILLSLENVRIRLGLKKIFSTGPQLLIDGDWLGGHLEITANASSRQAVAQLRNADVTRLPFVGGLGFQQAQLQGRISITENPAADPPFEFESIEIMLDKINKSEETTLYPQLTGLPMPITIPALIESSIEIKGSVNPELVNITQARLLSSLGNLEGTVRIDRPNSYDREIAVGLDGILSEGGFKLLKGPVELFSKKRVTSHSQPFRLDFRVPPKPFSLEISPR